MASGNPPQTGEHGHWYAPGGGLTVEYSLMVLEELRMAAEEGYQKIPHGGIEIGALLLGKRSSSHIRIEEWRPIACGHSKGPGFVLDEHDFAAMETLLEEVAIAAELRGLEPVGWFHTHTRSAVFFSEPDAAIHDRFFRVEPSVAMVLRPAKDQPATAAFFHRMADGRMQTGTPAEEFTVRPNASMRQRARRATTGGRSESAHAGAAMPGPRPPRRPRQPRAEAAAVQTASPEGLDKPVPTAVRQPSPAAGEAARDAAEGRFRWKVLAFATIVLSALAIGLVTRDRWLPAAPQSMSLRLREQEDQILITWNPSQQGVREAVRGTLYVQDGSRAREIPLSGLEARSGSATIVRQADDVHIRLTLYRETKPAMVEFARFVGNPLKRSLEEKLQDSVTERDQLQNEVQRMKITLAQEAARTQSLRGRIRELQGQLQQPAP